MQNHPLLTYVRFASFALGATLFVFMLYRSSQMVNNPVYVKGKPSLQWLATAAAWSPMQAASTTEKDVVATETAAPTPRPAPSVAADSAPVTTSEAPQSEQSAPKADHTPTTPNVKDVVQTAQANVPAGKALGKLKQAD